VSAQQKNDLWQRAENEAAAGKFREAFEHLRDFEHAVQANPKLDEKGKAAERYKAMRTRMNMYLRLRKPQNALEQLEKMERLANASADETVKNDFLYNKAIYYYTSGQTEKGNAAFKEMATKLTASKEYGKVDEVYQTLIANGRKSGSASIVAQAYSGYIAWKDSVNALKVADEINALKKQIQAGETSIAEKDSSLTSRSRIIIALCVLLAILFAVLVGGVLLLIRFIYLTRKQKKTIRILNENLALKAKFTSNISAQLTPALKKLDSQQPEVKALLNFSNHIQTLSQLETSMEEKVEKEETSLPAFCEDLVNQIRDKVKEGVVVNADVPKMSATFNKEYVTHILLHLLDNAAYYTPEGGHIRLEFKKRSVHKVQFLVSNTGLVVPEEMRENIFKPFLEVKDLTKGDGLGLPICRQMAMKMGGDLCIDPEFSKGTRFVLSINA
jgi:tetratricopeptide (TPR) repeat protein